MPPPLVTTSGRPSRLLFGSAPSLLQPLLQEATKAVVLTDETVWRLWGEAFRGVEALVLPPGEATKSLERVTPLYERLWELGLDREGLLVGIGGGVITDLTGFVATTFLRGVPFGFVPTTLLAQVDAALGGKNGVNFQGEKNQIGTLSQPDFVLMDGALLSTLPPREWRNGIAELIKTAAVGDRALFAQLEARGSGLLNPQELPYETVARAAEVKLEIVVQDRGDHGVRRWLNFGHTLGHLLELREQLRHGEAVSIGMVFAAALSCRHEELDPREAKRLEELLQLLGLPTRCPGAPPSMRALLGDKKRAGGALDFVLLKNLGEATLRRLSLTTLGEALRDLC